MVARVRAAFRHFAGDIRGNAAMIFALSLVAVIGAGGVGVDLARAMVAKNRMAAALDAAALAVGTTNGLTTSQLQAMAQQYFNANYRETAYGTPGPVSVSVDGQSISLSVASDVPTAILPILGIDSVSVGVSNQVTRALTKLRVALVLDVTGSMLETDATGTTKISALITATQQLLDTLRDAASTPGDVQVALVPFSKTVNVGTGNVNASWVRWTQWEAAPPNAGTIATTVGPGSACPWTTSNHGYRCQATSVNNSTILNPQTIPISGGSAGMICPSRDDGSENDGYKGRYYNGCYNSVATQWSTANNGSATTTTVCNKKSSCTTANWCTGYPQTSTKVTNSSNVNQQTYTYTTCSCTGSGSNRSCTRTAQPKMDTATRWSHTWVANAHSTWGGCLMDRDQPYDTDPTTPTGTSTYFPAENAQSCVPSVMMGSLGYNWSALESAVDAMTAGGSTNQTIGLAWGMQALNQGTPLNAPAADPDATNVIILLSDGMNTQNRWDGNGSDQSSAVNDRMELACAEAEERSIEVYTILVMAGNSDILEDCASGSDKYFALTTAGAIITTFNQIGQQLANLHLSR
jgi:Flp pilus assembly protein TadG